jgi:RNA polymerase sigma-70 factor (ECF subfamily)
MMVHLDSNFEDRDCEAAIRRVLGGDLQAFAVIVRRFERPLRGWLATHAPPGADVDDIAQASFVAAYRSLVDYRPGTNFAAWLFTIARFQLQTEATRLRRIADYHTRYAPELLARELELRSGIIGSEQDERLGFLSECLQAVDVRRRQLLSWRYDECISLAEMARRSDRTILAVKKQLWLIRRQLQDCIEAKVGAQG